METECLPKGTTFEKGEEARKKGRLVMMQGSTRQGRWQRMEKKTVGHVGVGQRETEDKTGTCVQERKRRAG